MIAPRSVPTDIFVLLVDRDEDTRRLYTEYLRVQGCVVDEAADGRDALAKALSRRHDVIVTGVRLPGIDGYQLCELLRRDAYTETTPIVVVTGEASETDRDPAHGVGATMVLRKPCGPETLWAAMRRALEASTDPGGSADVGQRCVEVQPHSNGHSRRLSLSRLYHRADTTTPPKAPPALLCPGCDSTLAYQQSHVGGVSERHPEQWDYYECPNGCGTFQYRQRTRKIRKAG